MPVHTIPAAPAGARKSWRKTVTGIDPNQTNGYAVKGEFVDAGAAYNLPDGVLVLGVDETPTGTHVTLWETGDGTLTAVKEITRKGPWAGKATIAAIGKLLAAHPWPAGARACRTRAATNTTAAECRRCHQPVKPGDGVQDRTERGFRYVQHRQCPPLRNSYPGRCGRCTGWIDAGEGVLQDRQMFEMYDRSRRGLGPMTTEVYLSLDGYVVLHETCPPPQERKAPPPIVNERAEACVLCWQTVQAGEGIYAHGAVTHTGQCPPADDGPTWTVSYGRPGSYNPRPTGGYTIGQALRVSVHETIHAVPVDTPGYRRQGTGMVSLVAVVVAEAKPIYCRDEDGNQPADLIGSNGWWFQARVRPATPDEAAEIGADEAAEAATAALQLRAELDIVRAADGEVPPVAEGLLGLPGVRVEPRRVGSLAFAASYGAYIHLRVDRDAGWVWVLRYNGSCGDDWSASNAGSYIARRVPLTTERAELIDGLAAQFGTIK